MSDFKLPGKFTVISGNRSRAPFWAVMIHNSLVCPGSLVEITFKNNKLIAYAIQSGEIPVKSISINRLHAKILQVADKDVVDVIKIDTRPDIITNLVVTTTSQPIKTIENPFIPDIIYLEKGYYVMLPFPPNMVQAIVTSDCKGIYVNGKQKTLSQIQLLQNNLVSEVCSNIPTLPENQELSPTSIKVDYCEFGIGGLGKQMAFLVEQVLISRIVNKTLQNKFKVKHIKGILLYGPPGTGKTLIGRNISKIIPKTIVKFVNGPELCAKMYGDTEANIRKIFEDARKDNKNTYVIIFDEIDSIGRTRGISGNHHDDKALTQLLTMLDGLQEINNMIVVGITNRKDVLDGALIRSGRLEFHLEIGLPDEEGRREILGIHLKSLLENGVLSDIDMSAWSSTLDGYSGADIESLITRAKNLALMDNCDVIDNTITQKDTSVTVSPLTESHLRKAYVNFKPTFSSKDDKMRFYISNYPSVSTDGIEEIKQEILSKGLNTETPTPFIINRTCLTNENKAVICHAVSSLTFRCVIYLSFNDFLGKTSSENCSILDKEYNHCLQSEKACLILDNLEKVRDHDLLLKVEFIHNNPIPSTKKLIIINI